MRSLARPALLTLALLPALASAAGKVVVVLPLDSSHAAGKLDGNAKAALEEMLRDVAVDNLAAGGWTVLTGETTLQVLKDNGVDASKCGDQSCHLSMAREIKADKFISGSVQFSDGEFTASIRLIDTESGRIAASTRVEGTTPKSLRKGFEAEAAKFFQKAGMTAAPAPAPAPTPAPAPVADTTPPPAPDKPAPAGKGLPLKLNQLWEGGYDCGGVITSMSLLVTDVAGDDVTATFSFSNEEIGAVGSYLLRGKYDRKAGQIQMKPGEWIVRPPGFDSIGLTGRVDEANGTFTGKMGHAACGRFETELAGAE